MLHGGEAKNTLTVSLEISGGKTTSFWPEAAANPTEVGVIVTVIVVVDAQVQKTVNCCINSNLRHTGKVTTKEKSYMNADQ